MAKRLISLLTAVAIMITATLCTTVFAADVKVIHDGETLTVTLEKGRDAAVGFVPEQSGFYRLTSDAGEGTDPAVSVYSGSTLCADADDMADSLNFDLLFYYEEGNDYTFYLSETAGMAAVYGIALTFVACVENVAFSPADGGYIHYENTAVYPAFTAGDRVTVTLDNGSVRSYLYTAELADFYCEETKTYISGDFGSVPELLPLFDKSTGEFLYKAVFSFLHSSHTIEVAKGENPVASVAYQPVKTIKAVENISGTVVEDSEGKDYFLYSFTVNPGDVLTVTYTNGKKDIFTLTETDNGFCFVNAEGNVPEEDYFYIDYLSSQAEEHWKCGTNYFTVHYFGAECQVPVQVIKTGWYKESGKWYYINTSGATATGWQKIGGKWYLFAYADGRMLTGWVKSGGKWYYFNAGGAMVSGWQKIGGKWYYFNAGGAMVSGWQKIGGKWYYFNAGGAMVTGWQKIGGKWYFFNSGGDMKTGWLNSGSKWYYFESSGAMLANTSRKIGSKTYQFNASGACMNP